MEVTIVLTDDELESFDKDKLWDEIKEGVHKELTSTKMSKRFVAELKYKLMRDGKGNMYDYFFRTIQQEAIHETVEYIRHTVDLRVSEECTRMLDEWIRDSFRSVELMNMFREFFKDLTPNEKQTIIDRIVDETVSKIGARCERRVKDQLKAEEK